MIHIGLFEGFGGFSLAAHWAGWNTYATCEIAEFPQRVLKHFFHDAYHHGDIKTLTYATINAELSKRFGRNWRNQPVIITGGFPCQPYSLAGKRQGNEDDRHLWPHMLRIIREVSPDWIVGENVPGLINWSGGVVFEEVQADLEAAGYEVQSVVLPACGIDAPHRRDRVWIIAHKSGTFAHLSNSGLESLQSGRENRIHELEVTSNSSGDGFKLRRPNKDRSKETAGKGNEQQRERVWDNAWRIGKQADVTNTQSEQSEWMQPKQHEISEQKQREFRGIYREDGSRLSPNTNSGRQSIQEHRQTQSGRIAEKSFFNNWSNFPTQPPLYTRNDGFSTELVRQFIRRDCDGILSEKEIDQIISKAESKWMNETIKGAGNAIVSGLALKLFEVINQMQNDYENTR